jgi:transcription antitermination factor NusG
MLPTVHKNPSTMHTVHGHWYAAMTFSGAEWQAHEGLDRRDVENWLPYYIAGSRRGRWNLGRVMPHLPGYIFVRVPANQSLRVVRETDGVQTLVSVAAAPIAIPLDILEELRVRLEPCRTRAFDAPAPTRVFVPGRPAKVISGAFEGLVVEIARVVSRERISVWLDAMGRKMELVLPAAALG